MTRSEALEHLEYLSLEWQATMHRVAQPTWEEAFRREPLPGQPSAHDRMATALGDLVALIAQRLLHRKGAPMTFDVSAFTSTLESLLKEDEVSIPMFDRAKDCTIPNAAKITGGDQYVIVEGNYLLLDQEDWRDLSQFWDYSVFVEADFDELERRLINRWLDHGLDHTAAKKRAHDNDIVNAATVLNHRMPSDLTLIN